MSLRSVVLFTLCMAQAQVSVLTYHNDLARSGQNLNEPVLTPDAVASGRFGRLFSHPVDGYVYAQPLYVPGLNISGKGPHNAVFVATEHDSVYAFDADSTDGANAQPLWQTSFINSSAGVTTVPAQNTNCDQIVPEIGITGTPVIEPGAGTLYAVAMTLENGAYHQRLHALDIATGAERPGSPVEIQSAGFVPRNYKQRPGLLLLNGIVYTAWSSHCDIGQYHGWLMGYDAKSLRQVSVYNSTPNGNQGSFWASGAAPAADSNSNIYLISGNGTFDADRGGPDLGESFIKLSPSNSLAVTDYFAPFNEAALSDQDVDTGSSGALLLPDAAGSAQHPHLLVSAGKEGRIYLIDRDNMGHFQSGSDSQIPQSLTGAINALFGIPAYFNNTVYFSAVDDNLKAFAIRDGQLSPSPTSQSATKFGFPGSVPSVSANGAANGIVWNLEPTNNGTLHAYDATNLSRELYQAGLDSYVKFSTPTIANGRVYAGTQNTMAVFGLSQAVGAGGLAIVNAATFSAGPVAPGSIISLFGDFASNAAPVTVRFNGVLAPVLYAGPRQINAQTPFEAALGQNTVVVSIGGADLTSGTVSVIAAAPGLFLTAPGRAAVVNQDNTVNSADHPAAAGSIMSAYLTGQGAVQPPVATGAPAPFDPLAMAVAPVTAFVGGQQADVSFEGLSPGSVGLFQVNLRLPPGITGEQSLAISVGGVSSNAATISVQLPNVAHE